MVLLGEMCSPMLDNAKLCVEFLSDGLSAKFVDNQGRHPLDARHLRRVAGLDELRRLPPGKRDREVLRVEDRWRREQRFRQRSTKSRSMCVS